MSPVSVGSFSDLDFIPDVRPSKSRYNEIIPSKGQVFLMNLLPGGVCVIALISVYLLGRSLYQLRPNREAVLQLTGMRRIRWAASALLIAPACTMVGTGIYTLAHYAGLAESYGRNAHLAFMMGQWMILTLSFLMLVVITRLGRRPTLSNLTSSLLAVPLTAYFSQYNQFDVVFSGQFSFPLWIGIFIIVTCYLFIGLGVHELVSG